jgi:MATE family multidrug resistance protein
MSVTISENTPILLNKRNQSHGYHHEFKWLLKNAIPLVISYLLQNSLQSISIISVGHLVSCFVCYIC